MHNAEEIPQNKTVRKIALDKVIPGPQSLYFRSLSQTETLMATGERFLTKMVSTSGYHTVAHARAGRRFHPKNAHWGMSALGQKQPLGWPGANDRF
jgi:hypothetical protein